MSDKAKAARALTAKSFRPGRRPDNAAEKARAYHRDALGRAITLESTEQLSEYLAANREINRRLNAALADPESSAAKLEALGRLRLTPLDLCSIVRESNNRWGQPPRSVLEVEGADRPPIIVSAPFESWHDREVEHAAAAGNGHAGNGATEH